MKAPWFQCVNCKETFELGEFYVCPTCQGELSIEYDFDSLKNDPKVLSDLGAIQPFWQRFAAVLPQTDKNKTVTLGEGNTPLIRADRLAHELGISELYLKLETTNPTGSFKDRQVAVAISKAAEWGRPVFATASSGNVGIALSAYAARTGGTAYVWVSKGTAQSKIDQIQVYGAQLFLLPDPEKGSVEEYFRTYLDMREYSTARNMVPMISARRVNPYMVEGSKTISYEILSQLGKTPEVVFGPIGGGGMLGGVWKGFVELQRLGLADTVPQMWGAQREEYFAPINKLANPVYDWSSYYRPLDGEWAWEAIQNSNGQLRHITPAEILDAQYRLASLEGVFAEPQGAYATAGLIKAAKAGALPNSGPVVSVITGIGLKDMAATSKINELHAGEKPMKFFKSLLETDLGGF